MHSLFSDGELLPSELARRALVLGHETIAITDHVDYSNIETIPNIKKAIDDINKNWDITVVLGAEITHAPTESIAPLAKKARKTNLAAVSCKDVDILGHPGLITEEEAEIALENDVTLEISARKGHCLGNGHVANIARKVGNDLVVDTDTHAPDDLITFDRAIEIALGAGMSREEAMTATVDNPRKILEKHGIY